MYCVLKVPIMDRLTVHIELLQYTDSMKRGYMLVCGGSNMESDESDQWVRTK